MDTFDNKSYTNPLIVSKSVDDVDDVLPQFSGNEPTFVVGVGASAGGLEALQKLFLPMPMDTNMAFVVVQHLSPDYKSLMDELLSRKTSLSVHVAVDKMTLQPNSIYLLPPKKEMIVSNGQLLLADRSATDTLNLPINTFFCSLAESYQDKAIAIILSGTGSDGSIGIDLVHDNGGMVLVQDPKNCQFDGMPVNAIATGNVDLVVRAEGMAEALYHYARRTLAVRDQFEESQVNGEKQRFAEILILLNSRFDIDFKHYKPSTITRRIERRLNMTNSSLKEYTLLLMSNENELDALYRDLLIGVTKFFRDPAAFNSLRSELSSLIKKLKVNEELRIWSVACASGQEPYSLAMLVHDICVKENHDISFKIFATDMHPGSIDFASKGIYQKHEIDGLSDEFRDRFFKRIDNEAIQIKPVIRRRIVFAQHNILKDPPFTKMALVTCRNLLIYFDVAAQQRVIGLLAFALHSYGRLFLGPSETLGRHERDFKVIDLSNRIFEKKRGVVIRPNVLGLSNKKYNNSKKRSPPSMLVEEPTTVPSKESSPRSQLAPKAQKALEVLLQIFVPPSILINGVGDVLHVFGKAGQLLSLDPGSPSLNLRDLVGEPAKTVLAQMLYRVKKNQGAVKVLDVEGFLNQSFTTIEMRNLPGFSADVQNFLVILTPSDSSEAGEDSIPIRTGGDDIPQSVPVVEKLDIHELDTGRVREIEIELRETKEHLQSTVEELETSNEELQATNEELMASNEELQSTNEELQSVNEELQSVNEELLTVNAEFKSKELQAAEAEADERSVIESSGIGILFLDNQLRVVKFSPLAKELFGLESASIHLPFVSLTRPLVQIVQGSLNQVLISGGMVEQQLVLENNTVYQMLINRLEPLDEQSSSRGVILTFINISSLYSTQNQLMRSEFRLQSMLDNLTDGYVEWALDEESLYLSPNTLITLGYPQEASLTWDALLGDEAVSVVKKLHQCNIAKEHFQTILSLRKKTGDEPHWMLCKGHFVSKEKGSNEREVTRFYGHFIDMHDYKQLEYKLHAQMTELERSNSMLEEFAHMVSHDLKAPLRHSSYSLRFLKEALEKQDLDQVNREVDDLFGHMSSLKNLIDDVIRFSRVSAEKKQVGLVDLNEVIESALSLNESAITERKVTVLKAAMPTVYGDKSMLVHMFQNLIGNACKYNEHDSPIIDISYEDAGTVCSVRVKDNGIGMDPNSVDLIFKPFQRLVTKCEYEGSGVGLAICKILIEQHNGSIRVETAPNKGSVFIISLPLKSAGESSSQ